MVPAAIAGGAAMLSLHRAAHAIIQDVHTDVEISVILSSQWQVVHATIEEGFDTGGGNGYVRQCGNVLRCCAVPSGC